MRLPPPAHKFKTGQSLIFAPQRQGLSTGSVLCKVVQLLPFEDGVAQYRIRCSNENVERVVKEHTLSRRE